MRMIDADNVLNGIEELKKSPWFNRGKEIVKSDPGFQHIGYLERKEAVETVRDLCIRQEPTVGGWISVKDHPPEKDEDVIIYGYYVGPSGETYPTTIISDIEEFKGCECVPIAWMPLPEPPKE